MGCGFDLVHYRELLDAAQAGGYRFAFFDRSPEPGTVLLRHDVDLSLDAALAVAELEAEAGAAATYFLMTRSEFYNLDCALGRGSDRAPARARAPRRACTPSGRRSTGTSASTPSSPGTTRTPSTCASRSRAS